MGYWEREAGNGAGAEGRAEGYRISVGDAPPHPRSQQHARSKRMAWAKGPRSGSRARMQHSVTQSRPHNATNCVTCL